MKTLAALSESDFSTFAHIRYYQDHPLSVICDSFTMDRLIFEFEKNDYFSNKELEKIYVMGDDDTIGPTLDKAEGCDIEWKSGKNPCVKILKKKSKKTGKTMTKEEQQDSFFRFFSPPEVGCCSFLNAHDSSIGLIRIFISSPTDC